MAKSAFKKNRMGKYAADFMGKKRLVKVSNRKFRRAGKTASLA